MRYFSLPGIEKPVSVLCLGTGGMGSAQTADESFTLLDAFAERGGTFLDTAHVYADWIPGGAGASERTVGAWLRSRDVWGRFVVGTKGGHPKLETMHLSRLRPEDIAQDLAESLERLQTETIDLYWLHRDDPAVPVGEILSALNDHLAAGAVRAIGASNWSTVRLEEAADYAAAHGLTGFCASQIAWSLARSNEPYNAAMRTIAMDKDALRWYCAAGLRVIPYTAQASGFFAHPYDETAARFSAYHSPVNARRWQRAQTMARERGMSPNAVALAYLLNHPCGGAAIVGPHTGEQMEDTCRAADLALSDAELAFLEAH
ncbi:MAG: aldo/keto reductase [Armatimonadetes bacterium]|nr:aldo/keto reductase [Armatimonadota bacterium]